MGPYGETSYGNCDEDSIPSSNKASSLTPNTFYKICPGHQSAHYLGNPTCGDGSPFSFFFTRPPQRADNNEKILIEFQGGGACWDETTCNERSSYLTFPEDMNAFVGYSCSEAQAGIESIRGYPVSLLCSQKIGQVDFTGYNFIVVPYCTQDVHLGDNFMLYNDDDGGGSGGTYHHGAHNTMSVLRWIFKNFPNPSHIALTGCSAGATPLPVVYDLLSQHYNTIFKGGRTANINVILDSPVYLTPEYFLSNGIDNWNPWSIVRRTQFNINKWRYDEMYSTKLWDNVLRRGSNKDHWGIISHTNDPISMVYWEYMGGNYGNGDGEGASNDNGDDESKDWWNDLTDSIDMVMENHRNVDTFFINGEGHCSFGLSYALEADGFEEWGESILKEQRLLMQTESSVPLFTVSAIIGLGLFVASLKAEKKKKREIDLNANNLLNDQNGSPTQQMKWREKYLPFISFLKPYPITAGYFIMTTFYFFSMLIVGGFTHPLNNPSLGPSAKVLSSFGINNPTLIANFQLYRLVTANFLCSGVISYLIVSSCLLHCVRHVEKVLDSYKHFSIVCVVISLGNNLVYACLGNGASCGTIALVLGLQSFSISMNKDHGSEFGFPRPWLTTSIFTILTCILLPFNNWIMIAASMLIGYFTAPLCADLMQTKDEALLDRTKETYVISTPLRFVGFFYFIMFVTIFLNRSRPNEMYRYPFLTGCETMYSTDVDSFMENLYSQNERNLSGDSDDNEGSCAQFCIPHIIERFFFWGVGRYSNYALDYGLCEENGYRDYVADKTFSYWSYPLDVELFYETDVEE